MSKSLEAANCRGGEPGVTVFCAGTGLPFFLDLEVSDVPGGWPRGGVTRIDLPNRHLEYALTWFALAGTLLAVFVAFAASRLRSLQTGSS
jgi:cytochrome oxidase assembly protein ShyY1